jgi:excisionase family DNA binding protein
MNFADAIRRAAQVSGAPLGQPEPRSEEVEPAAAAVNHTFDQPAKAEEQTMDFNKREGQEETSAHPVNGHVVRLELVLTPEQLKGLFGAVVANQHSVMTLREAANYLRINAHALEEMAGAGEVPGLLVDSKWRFTRQGLDDWLNTHSKRKEA